MTDQKQDPIDISQHDRDILRRLANELAEVAALPIHKEKRELWRRLNDLEAHAPPGVDQRNPLARDECQ